MENAVFVALITGACAVIGDIVIAAKNSKELFAKLDKQSEIADERIKGEIAVIHTEVSELRKAVEKHNSVVERVYKLETESARHDEQIKTLFNK